MGAADHVERDREIVGDEIGRIGTVRVNAADLGGRQEHRIRLGLREPAIDAGAIRQVEAAALRESGRSSPPTSSRRTMAEPTMPP